MMQAGFFASAMWESFRTGALTPLLLAQIGGVTFVQSLLVYAAFVPLAAWTMRAHRWACFLGVLFVAFGAWVLFTAFNALTFPATTGVVPSLVNLAASLVAVLPAAAAWQWLADPRCGEADPAAVFD